MADRKTARPTPEKLEQGRRIKLALDHAGKTQRELAQFLPVSDPTVHDYVTGEVTPRPHRLVRIANFTGSSVDWLLLRDEEMTRDVASKLTTLGLTLGRERLDFLLDLPAEELCELVDRHELAKARKDRRRRADEAGKTLEDSEE